MSSFICNAFSSMNSILNFSMFSCGMGFIILVVLFVIGMGRANKVFVGICNITGEWSELRLWSVSVVDVYSVLFDVLM